MTTDERTVPLSLPAALLARTVDAARRTENTVDSYICAALRNYLAREDCAQIRVMPHLMPTDATHELLVPKRLYNVACSMHDDATPFADIAVRALNHYFDLQDSEPSPLRTSVTLPQASYSRLKTEARLRGWDETEMICRLLAGHVYATDTPRMDIPVPECAEPFGGGINIGPGLMRQMTHVMRQHDRPGRSADSTILIARAVQRYVDALPPAPAVMDLHAILRARVRQGPRLKL